MKINIKKQDILLCSAVSAASHILNTEITSSSAKSLGYLQNETAVNVT